MSASVATRVNEIKDENCAAIKFVMKIGALATSSVPLGSASEITHLRFCFDGLSAESGTAPYVPMAGDWRFLARDPVQQVRVDDVLDGIAEGLSGFAGSFADPAKRFETGVGASVTAAAGRQSVERVTAIYQAARSGTGARRPLENTTPLYESWTP